MKISANKFVVCTYNLYVPGEGSEELMEEATVEQPLQYIHGMNMMLPAFEEKLFGLEVGAKFDFELSTEEAYGEPQDDAVIELDRNVFLDEEGNFDDAVICEGNILPMRDQEGNTLQGIVREVREDAVVMDFNHPLAGEKLHFVGEVIEVREPSPEDMKQVFGEGSGCSGCGSDEDGGCGGCGGGCC